MEDSPANPWQSIVDRLAVEFPAADVTEIGVKVSTTWAMFDGDATDEESRVRAVEWMVRSELDTAG